MTEWTKEPWSVDVIGQGDPYAIHDGSQFKRKIAATATGDFGCSQSMANARRIVAAVNACAGIEDPQAWIDNARFYSHETVKAITKQRDDLLAALKMFVWPHQEGDRHNDTERQEIGRAVIARAEGREVAR